MKNLMVLLVVIGFFFPVFAVKNTNPNSRVKNYNALTDPVNGDIQRVTSDGAAKVREGGYSNSSTVRTTDGAAIAVPCTVGMIMITDSVANQIYKIYDGWTGSTGTLIYEVKTGSANQTVFIPSNYYFENEVYVDVTSTCLGVNFIYE